MSFRFILIVINIDELKVIVSWREILNTYVIKEEVVLP